MASLIRKPCIIALQLQLCTARPRTRGTCTGTVGARVFLVGKRVQEVWEKKRKKGKIIIIIIIKGRQYHVLVPNLNRLQSNVFIDLGCHNFFTLVGLYFVSSIFRIKVV